MSKVKQWATDVAEKAVDKIINQVKQNLITKETASADILKVENEYVRIFENFPT